MRDNNKTWHQQHRDDRTFGQRAADGVAKWMGSWYYIVVVCVFIALYLGVNALYLWMPTTRAAAFDKYPFILLNLILGIFVLLGAPLIMMSQKRQEERERLKAERDYQNDARAVEIIEKLDEAIARIEIDKLDRILEAVCREPVKKPVTKKPKAAKVPPKKKPAAKMARKPKGEKDGKGAGGAA